MIRVIGLAFALCALSLPARSLAQEQASGRPPWWGGEVLANQTPGPGNGFGYGRYEAILQPSTGMGSVSGFFVLCYAGTDFSDCDPANWKNEPNPGHFEVDVEFTPAGNNPSARNWIKTTCLTDNDCQVSHPNPAPRTPGGFLQAESYNQYPLDPSKYPKDEQVYAFDDNNTMYTSPQRYIFTVLPGSITWAKQLQFSENPPYKVLYRTLEATNPERRIYTGYSKFNQLLKNGQIKLRLNVWDGTTVGWSGNDNTNRTSGTALKVLFVSYKPAACDGNNCTIADKPSFEANFMTGTYIKDGKSVGLNPVLCTDTNDNSALFWKIKRGPPNFPVYVSPNNVTCTGKGIEMFFKPGA